MNFPHGAEIPWPALFDFSIAGVAKAAGVTAGDREGVARVAALLALVVGVALLPLVAWLGKRLLGGGLWLDAALLVALLPANIRFGAVGAADQHGAELLFCCGIFLAFVSSWRGAGQAPPGRSTGPAVLGILMAAAFWNWLGSALYLLVLVGATGLWRVVGPAGDVVGRAMSRALLVGGGLAAVLLTVSIALFAPAGALLQGGLNGLTGLHVAMCGMVAIFGGLLLLANGVPGSGVRAGRLWQVASAAALALAPVLAVPAIRHGIARGLTALSRANPWYDSIVEYQPLLQSGTRTLHRDLVAAASALGLGLFAMPFAAVALWRRWKESEADRPALFFLFFWGAVFLGLTAKAARFQLYLVIPMALWICAALRELGAAAGRRAPGRAAWLPFAIPVAGVVLVACTALGNAFAGDYARQQPGFESDLIPALQWLRPVHGVDPSRPAVMAEWSLGHLIQYFARKPVIATPFGTEATDAGSRPPRGSGGMKDWAAFLFAFRAEEAEAVLARRRVGFVVLRSPKNEVLTELGFAPPGTPAVGSLSFGWLGGPQPTLREDFSRLVASRLYYFDGMRASGDEPALGGFRLLYESPIVERIPNFPPAHLFKVFGVVPGARIVLRGGAPGSAVTARVRIQTNQNRIFEWATRAPVDEAGRGELRLPYVTGPNGLVQAGPYRLTDGVHGGSLVLDEKDVAGGETDVDLDP
jgi:asparagine N-glycosylation enzyme membrane subunit Stt3